MREVELFVAECGELPCEDGGQFIQSGVYRKPSLDISRVLVQGIQANSSFPLSLWRGSGHISLDQPWVLQPVKSTQIGK